MNSKPFFSSWDGTRISYQVLGNRSSDRTIIFINGFLCTESYWVYLIEELSPDYRLVTFDLRGHQFSGLPANPENTAIADSARDVAALMDHLDIERAIFAGFSLGVQILFEFYGRYTERCQALMAMTGSFENPLSTFYNMRVPDIFWKVLLKTAAKRFSGPLNRVWHGAFHLPFVHPLAKLMKATNATKEGMQGFYDHHKYVDVPNGMKMALGAVEHSARHVLPTVKVPTLVVGGGADIFTPPSLSYTMRDEIPDVEFLLVEGGTHTTLIEYPEVINEKVRAFLCRL